MQDTTKAKRRMRLYCSLSAGIYFLVNSAVMLIYLLGVCLTGEVFSADFSTAPLAVVCRGAEFAGCAVFGLVLFLFARKDGLIKTKTPYFRILFASFCIAIVNYLTALLSSALKLLLPGFDIVADLAVIAVSLILFVLFSRFLFGFALLGSRFRSLFSEFGNNMNTGLRLAGWYCLFSFVASIASAAALVVVSGAMFSAGCGSGLISVVSAAVMPAAAGLTVAAPFIGGFILGRMFEK